MSDYSDEEKEIELKSKINSAGLVNITLNNLWVEYFKDFRDGKFLSANNDLDCIWTILGGDVEEDGTVEKDYKKIEKDLSESGSLQDIIEIQGFGKVSEEQIRKLCKQKGLLQKKAVFLRRLQNKQGKGSAYEDNADDYMDK